MKYVFLMAVLILTPFSAKSSDLRQLNPAATCTDAIANEKSLGSELRREDEGYYSFRGTSFGREMSIAYWCDDDILERIVYIFHFDNFLESKNFFLEKKPYFMAEYGMPYVDQSSEAYEKYMNSLGFEIEEEEMYALYWEEEAKNILFSASRISIHHDESAVSIYITLK